MPETYGNKNNWYSNKWWIVAVSGTFIYFFGGNLQYTFGTFVKPLVQEFGWSRAAVSGIYTARALGIGLFSPLTGIMSDRYGPKTIILVGLILAGLSPIFAAFSTNLWQFNILLGALNGIGMAAFATPAIGMITKRLGQKAPVANGIVMSGFGFAQIILSPVVTYLILNYGLQTCFMAMGVSVLTFGIVAGYFATKAADNYRTPENATATVASTADKAEYTLIQATRTMSFWLLFLIVTVASVSYFIIITHVAAAANDVGIPVEAAALTLTVSGITNTLGKLGVGLVASRMGAKATLILFLVLEAVPLFFLAGARTLPVFYIATAINGLGYGGIVPLLPIILGILFGNKAIGSLFGTVIVASCIGSSIGPIVAGFIFDTTGSYYIAFLYAATLIISRKIRPSI